MKKKIIIAAVIIAAVSIILLALFVIPQFIAKSAALSDSELDSLYAQIMPNEITLPGTWQNIGPKLIESGAVNLDEFKSLYESYGNPLTDEQIKFFTEGSDEPIVITQENMHFTLNTLWALGLVNKNAIYEKEPMSKYIESGQAANLASTGGWSLGTKNGGELLNSAEIIIFADEIAETFKDVNSIWFAQTYLEMSTFIKATEGKDWNDVDPGTVIGKDYSSASGAADVRQKLQKLSLSPEAQTGGGGCGV